MVFVSISNETCESAADLSQS